MRLKKSRNTAEEELVSLLNKGYQILTWLRADYNSKRQEGSFRGCLQSCEDAKRLLISRAMAR